MGTGRHESHNVSLGFSRADGSAPDTARAAVLYGNNVPISGQADSREFVPYKEKRTLPGTSADVSEFVCVAAHGPFDDRFARQNRYGPPPEFPLASSYSGIVHHLSGPNVYALAPPLRRCGRDGPVVRLPATGRILPRQTGGCLHFHCAFGFRKTP
ncbi:uncharacterized protein [Argopecten irradians]